MSQLEREGKGQDRSCPVPGCKGKIKDQKSAGTKSWYCPECGATSAGVEFD